MLVTSPSYLHNEVRHEVVHLFPYALCPGTAEGSPHFCRDRLRVPRPPPAPWIGAPCSVRAGPATGTDRPAGRRWVLRVQRVERLFPPGTSRDDLGLRVRVIMAFAIQSPRSDASAPQHAPPWASETG